MRDTVRNVLRASFDAYATTPRGFWMGSWPGQVVLAVDCMYWTAGTAAAIVRGTLNEYAIQLTQELLQVGMRSALVLQCVPNAVPGEYSTQSVDLVKAT